jgi:hypothetical protein
MTAGAPARIAGAREYAGAPAVGPLRPDWAVLGDLSPSAAAERVALGRGNE